ncbi:MAG: GDP-mannose 4,6-dehydratase [Candidatus Altiarchaeota archaeon]
MIEIRVLVTGASGFIGSHLCRLLLEEGCEVYASYLYDEELYRINDIKEEVTMMKCDVADRNRVEAAIEEAEPEVVYHLAAQSFPTVSWEKPAETLRTNAEGTVNIFESVMRQDLDSRIIVACSSAEYGLVREDEVPVNEEHTLLPLHPYGVSKVAQDLLAYQYHKNHGVKTVRLRVFNTTGPSKTNDVCSDFTRRAVEAEKKGGGVMRVGNLEPRRDFTDVRDMVRAFRLSTKLADKGDVYNVCSMKAVKVREVLDTILSLTENVTSEIDEALLRPSDEPVILGDNTKIRKACGWKPEVALDKTLSDMMDYWRGM